MTEKDLAPLLTMPLPELAEHYYQWMRDMPLPSPMDSAERRYSEVVWSIGRYRFDQAWGAELNTKDWEKYKYRDDADRAKDAEENKN